MQLLVLLFNILSAYEGQENPEHLLQFLAATQVQTSSEYSTLSYDVAALNTSYLPGVEKLVPVPSKYKVCKRSTTTLLTWESQLTVREKSTGASSNSSKIELSNERRVTKILRTDSYIALWLNVAEPDIQLYWIEDWGSNLSGYEDRIKFYHRPVDISAICFGYVTPFHELLRSGDSSRWLLNSFDAATGAKITRMVPGKDGEYSDAMTLELVGTTGAVRHAEFFPARGTVAVEYAEALLGLQKLWVPVRYRFFSEGTDIKSHNEAVLEFSNYSNEIEEPSFTLSDMGVPSGARMLRYYPDSTISPFVWDGEEPNLSK